MRRLSPSICCVQVFGLLIGACSDHADDQLARVLTKTFRGAISLTLGDDDQLYFSEFDPRGDNIGNSLLSGDESGGSLYRVDPERPEPKRFSGRNATSLIVRDGFAYFADPVGSAGAVGRVATSGGDPELYTSYNGPLDVAVDDQFVYWIEQGMGGGVLRAPREGGETERMAAADDLWGNLVLSDEWLYWLTLEGLARMPKEGGTIEPLLEAGDWDCCLPNRPTNFRVSGDSIYLATADLNAGGLARMTTAGEDLRALLPDQPSTRSLTIVDGYLYWARGNDNRAADVGVVEVMRMKLDGDTPERVASKQNGVSGIVVTAAQIYWLNSIAGQLMNVAKKDLAL